MHGDVALVELWHEFRAEPGCEQRRQQHDHDRSPDDGKTPLKRKIKGRPIELLGLDHDAVFGVFGAALQEQRDGRRHKGD